MMRVELKYGMPRVNAPLSMRERLFFRRALTTGVMPMFCGMGIVGLFILTGSPIWIVAGMWMLLIGAVTVFVGLGVTAMWGVEAIRLAKMRKERTPVVAIALMTLLQLSNFAVAFGCIAFVSWIIPGSD